MFFIKKKNSINKVVEDRTVDGAEVWLVSWNAHKPYGYVGTHPERVAKAFLNENDAKDFVNSLEDAQKLLQNTYDIHIKIEVQK